VGLGFKLKVFVLEKKVLYHLGHALFYYFVCVCSTAGEKFLYAYPKYATIVVCHPKTKQAEMFCESQPYLRKHDLS
jgi:hypothetical protein